MACSPIWPDKPSTKKLMYHPFSHTSQTPWSRDYSPRPKAATTSQKLDGTSMLLQNSVLFIRPPVDCMNSSASHARNDVSEIIPRLYISDLSFAENPDYLSSYRITHILSTLPNVIFRPPPSLLLHCQPVRMQINLEDSPFAELAAHLPRTTTFIRDALTSNPDAKVLVHCAEGVSRSVSVVAAYLMAEYGWSPTDAVEYIKTKRVVADPNFGFVQQLHEYARDSLSLSNPVTSPLPPFSAPP